jgi:Domain of unknown function (DUF4265)
MTHDSPVCRERSTGVIRALIPNPPDGEEWFEQLWARKIDEQRYEVCCIPFATYDFALGDIVEVGPSGESEYLAHRVLEPSGRRVLRVWLADSGREAWDELQGVLRSRRLLFEFRKPALVAIDVTDEAAATDLEAELQKMESAGKLRFERGSEGYR